MPTEEDIYALLKQRMDQCCAVMRQNMARQLYGVEYQGFKFWLDGETQQVEYWPVRNCDILIGHAERSATGGSSGAAALGAARGGAGGLSARRLTTPRL